MQYLKDVRVELSHVSWPTQKQAMVYTLLVIIISVITSLFLGFFDFAFVEVIKRLVG
jgi:preprotein translocase SecE subunit